MKKPLLPAGLGLVIAPGTPFLMIMLLNLQAAKLLALIVTVFLCYPAAALFGIPIYAFLTQKRITSLIAYLCAAAGAGALCTLIVATMYGLHLVWPALLMVVAPAGVLLANLWSVQGKGMSWLRVVGTRLLPSLLGIMFLAIIKEQLNAHDLHMVYKFARVCIASTCVPCLIFWCLSIWGTPKGDVPAIRRQPTPHRTSPAAPPVSRQ